MSKGVIVYVHGIRSSSAEAFTSLRASIIDDRNNRFDDWAYPELFEYFWTQGVAVGASKLEARLRAVQRDQPGVPIYIVAHSMGGLVSRLTLLQHPDLCVKRLIMLATPNYGAISTAQQGLFWQIPFSRANGLVGIFPRLQGLYDLVNVPVLFEPFVSETVDCEYVTIPGRYYHANRSLVDRLNFLASGRTYVVPAMAAEVLGTMFPFRITFKRPHDGIVEHDSVTFVPEKDPVCEKRVSIRAVELSKKTYCNVDHDKAFDLDHGTILECPEVADLVKDLLTCTSLAQWKVDNESTGWTNYRAAFGEAVTAP